MFEFHSLHTLCHFSSSYYPPQDAPNFNGHGIPNDFWHLNSLLLCRLLLSAHPPLLHNPCFASPRLADQTIAWHIGLVYQRAFYHFNAQVARDLKEAKLLESCWVREYEGLEAEREALTKKRSRRIPKVQEESIENAAKIVEVKAKDLDEKMKNIMDSE
ncbi:hypothetical protein ACE6H2_025021 [Prunus campanulata]